MSKAYLLPLSINFILYISTVFVKWEYNPKYWGVSTRATFISFFIAGCIIGYVFGAIIDSAIEEDAEKKQQEN